MEVRFLLLVVVWCSTMAASLSMVEGRDKKSGFISIDCGAPNNYTDKDLELDYVTDDGFVDFGTNMQISTDYINDNIQSQGKNLRMFPDGKRNCYTLRPDKGAKNNTYLVRAEFYYGNYDNKDQTPAFDLHIGVNYWATVNSSEFVYSEVIYVPSTDDIQVCLINTGNGIPFISRLELRLLNNSIYQLSSGLLVTRWRSNVGGSVASVRHPGDVYDRIWSNGTYNSDIMNTTSIDSLGYNNDDYKVPAQVLSTAAKAADVNSLIALYWSSTNITDKFCFYFHFAELEKLPGGQQRELEIYVNGIFIDNVELEYLKPVTKSSCSTTQLVTGPNINFSINATNGSGYPPILNAFEKFAVSELLHTTTNLYDVNAINEIKKLYGLKAVISWQGDPCVPSDYSWDGLNCSYDGVPPRIVSLDLSSSTLGGNITESFSKLSALVSLNLSRNQLMGPVPESLAELPNLKTLDLSGNNLTGSIPASLQKKVDDGTLKLILADNPNLCLKVSSCERKKKTNSVTVPVVAATLGSAVLFLVVIAIIWRVKGKTGHTKGAIKAKNRPFTYNEVMKITDNFKTVIGEGGFGKVYLGTLTDDTKVAVKMLSKTSRQGYKEFQAEAQLLMIVHHRNLVSLVGYCDDSENMALIYEFMVNGNLRQHLSEQSIGARVLTWTERLRIAIDAAQGLDYLHNGCKPPIIHRDLKTPNILLSENMQAKIADFGLSKAFSAENESYIFTQPAGTPGYLDPEFQSSGNLNRKSDVYSFGIILFELITRLPAVIRRESGNIHILQWVIPIIESGDIQSILDRQLDGQFNINSAWKFVETATSCVQETASQRPDISHVLAELKECWTIEMVTERTQGIGSSGRRLTTGSFGIASINLDYTLVPSAR